MDTKKNLGLLMKLPINYKIQYVKIKPDSVKPLDLTVYSEKSETNSNSETENETASIVMSSPLKKRYKQLDLEADSNVDHKPANVILSPLKKRYRVQEDNEFSLEVEKTQLKTPEKAKKPESVNKRSSKNQPPKAVPSTKDKKNNKSIRKLKFDDEFNKYSSPVSGTIIRPLEEIAVEDSAQCGDIPEQYNIVEITEEAKQELALIPNVIGGYQCKLCKIDFDDAFCLARHRCLCIVLLEYKCPECQKKFNCPANLASHRRWHQPRSEMKPKQETGEFHCKCGKSFKRIVYLKKHQQTHKNEQETKRKATSNKSKISVKSTVEEREPIKEDQEELYIPETVFNFNSNSNSNSTSTSNFKASPETNENSNLEEDFPISSNFTEDENIAIRALESLRSGSSVIRHTLLTA